MFPVQQSGRDAALSPHLMLACKGLVCVGGGGGGGAESVNSRPQTRDSVFCTSCAAAASRAD